MKLILIAFSCTILVLLLGGCAQTSPPPSPTALPTQVLPTVRPTHVPTMTPTPSPTAVPANLESLLTGLPVDPEYWQWAPIVVIIPSDSEQYALSQASVVYEAVTEYEIPRYMAVFEGLEAESLGPIRSARPYYGDWACPYAPLFVHWGGSPQALTRLAELDCLRPLDGLTYGSAYFFRVPDDQVPWNDQFSRSSLLYRYLGNWEITRSVEYQGYPHKLDAPLAERPLGGIVSLAFRETLRYLYDRESNAYLREYGGQPHLDMLSGEQHRVKNVVVIFTPVTPIPGDDQGRVEIQTIGEGEALVFQDGTTIQGRWIKESPEAELRFLDETGQEISFNRGNIWIEVLAPDQEVIVEMEE